MYAETTTFAMNMADHIAICTPRPHVCIPRSYSNEYARPYCNMYAGHMTVNKPDHIAKRMPTIWQYNEYARPHCMNRCTYITINMPDHIAHAYSNEYSRPHCMNHCTCILQRICHRPHCKCIPRPATLRLTLRRSRHTYCNTVCHTVCHTHCNVFCC